MGEAAGTDGRDTRQRRPRMVGRKSGIDGNRNDVSIARCGGRGVWWRHETKKGALGYMYLAEEGHWGPGDAAT